MAVVPVTGMPLSQSRTRTDDGIVASLPIMTVLRNAA